MKTWRVLPSSKFRSWVSMACKNDPSAFNNIKEGYDRVIHIAEIYSKYNVIVCQLGLLMPIPNMDFYLHCTIDETHNCFYIHAVS